MRRRRSRFLMLMVAEARALPMFSWLTVATKRVRRFAKVLFADGFVR